MSVLIKGIKMPTCCEECVFVRTVGLDRWKCELSGCDFNSWDVGWEDKEENKYIRHSSCPLVEIPSYGRLIDADALDVISYCSIPQVHEDTFDDGVMFAEQIDLLPTIIPADGGK